MHKNMKNISSLLVCAIVFTGIAAFLPSHVASAAEQTKAQATKCYNQYNGKELSRNSSNPRVPGSSPYDSFASSNCAPANNGNCTTFNVADNRVKVECTKSASTRPENTQGLSTKTPANCGDISTNIIKCDTNGGDPVTSLLLQLFNFAAVGVGIAVMGGIIWGGVLYASSNGDSGKVNQGKTAIVNSIIGLLLFIFMYAIVNFIVPGGLFR